MNRTKLRQKRKKLQLHETVMNILYCGMNESDFSRICTCTSAKKIWNNLEAHMKEQVKLEILKLVFDVVNSKI